jgi:hypothetical protein
MDIEYYSGNKLINMSNVPTKDAAGIIEKAHMSAMQEMVDTEKPHVLYAITMYDEADKVKKIIVHRNTALTDGELDEYIVRYPNSILHVIHSHARHACKKILERRKLREIRPLTLKEANAFVEKHHRHHGGTVGCKFSIGLFESGDLMGVAICGRPVSRFLDNGAICEINRLCTNGGENACSMLYGACCRIAKNMGYEKIITYILESESGASLKASNFVCEGKAGGTHWTGKRNKGQNIPHEMKMRWSRSLT